MFSILLECGLLPRPMLKILIFIFMVWNIWDMVGEIFMYDIPVSVTLITYMAIILGAIGGPLLIEMRRYAEVYSKDGRPFNMVYGVATLGSVFLIGLFAFVFTGYVTDIAGDITSISDLMYALVGFCIAFFGGILLNILALNLAGDTLVILYLDINKDGVVNAKDATAAIGIVADGVKEAVGAVEDAIKK